MQRRLRLRGRDRHLAAAATVVALAVALVGCAGKSSSGGQGQGSGGGSGAKKFAPLTLNPNQVVAASAVKTLAARSAKMAMTLQVTGASATPLTVSAEGAFDFTGRRGTMLMHLPNIGDIQAVFDKGVVYEKLGAALHGATGGGKPWIKIDLTKMLGTNAGLGVPQGGNDPSQGLALLFGAAGVTKVGSASIRGVPTTHYHGTMDLTKAAQQLSPQYRNLYESTLKALGSTVKSLPADLWIDDLGRLRRISYAMKLAGATTKTTVDYFSFGTPVSVQIPPADQVTTLG
jgi:hypothetical protein